MFWNMTLLHPAFCIYYVQDFARISGSWVESLLSGELMPRLCSRLIALSSLGMGPRHWCFFEKHPKATVNLWAVSLFTVVGLKLQPASALPGGLPYRGSIRKYLSL